LAPEDHIVEPGARASWGYDSTPGILQIIGPYYRTPEGCP
jgi:hypothetical protein